MNSLEVVFLEHDYFEENFRESHKCIILKVSKIILDVNEIDNETISSDIALLRLNNDGIQFYPSTFIRPVCLPIDDGTYYTS